jgi:glycosyltransferase involved in cell wall biosynthesis
VSGTPRVSIITVFLNGERFLEEAICSVLRQTAADWELLLVDDGSSDGSTAIARRHASEQPERIRYLEHPGHENRGAAAARNLGVRHARGEYIAFLDADDVYLPRKLEEQVPLLDSLPEAAMLYGRTRLWYSWDRDTRDHWREGMTTPAPRLDALIAPPELVIAHLRDEHVYPTTCSVLIRREAIDAVGGFEEAFRDTYEDMTLFMKLLLRYPVYVADRCWDWYRKHPGSTWAVAQRSGAYRIGRPYPARAAFLRWLEGYIEQEGITDADLRRALDTEMRPYRYPRLFAPLGAARGLAHELADRVRPHAKRWLPMPVQGIIKHGFGRLPGPPLGWVRFGSLRRLTPVSPEFGFDRGTPIDRYYIESFLESHAADVRGRVLEIGEDRYTHRLGGERVEWLDVLHVDAANPEATMIADLQDADHLEGERFDCIIFTQTLQYIYDARAAIHTLHRLLRPGGVLLATFPGLSETGDDYSGAAWYWSFTPASARRLFSDVFRPEAVEIRHHGNVFAATAFLHGVAVEEVSRKKLDYRDPRYIVTNTVRAVKPAQAG